MKLQQFFLPLLLFLTLFLPGKAQQSSINHSQFLQSIAESDSNLWIRVHAAEALSQNNFSVNAKRLFSHELGESGSERIGALRVMARSYAEDGDKIDSIAKKILAEFGIAQNEHAKLVALESLGKLGYFISDEQILKSAQTADGGIQVFAQWVLSNSKEPNDIDKLADFLFSNDSVQFRYAAYALRFHKEIPVTAYQKMKDKIKSLNEEHSFRVYLLSALYVHAPEDDVGLFKEKLLDYLDAATYERYEVYEALAKRGSEEDLFTIRERLKKEIDTDVRVAASNAYLANEHYLRGQFAWIDWSVIIVYGVFLIGVGWYYSYKQKTKEDYYLGGRSVNPFIAGISLYVSFFSAITFLAIPGEVIKYGPLYPLATIAGVPIILVIGNYFLIPFFMNLKIHSAYEILEKPFGRGIRVLGSVIFITTRFLWMALLLFLASKATVVMIGWGEEYMLPVILILGLITVYYTTVGGLKAVLFTDVFQFFVLLLGAILVIALIGVKHGGMNALFPDSWSENWGNVDFISFNPYVRLTIFFAFINNITWWICTSGSDQMAIQRFMSTKDLKGARRTFIHSQLGMIVITTILMFVGFAIMNFYNYRPNLLHSGKTLFVEADFLFPHFIATQFPSGLLGLIIAALFSASMSSLSAGVNSVGSIITNDILPSIFKRSKKFESVKSIRLLSAIIGVVAVLLSLAIKYVPGNIVEVTSKTNGLFIAPLFNLFFMGFFVRKAKPFGVLMGSVYGFMVALLIGFWDVFTGNPPLSFLWIAFSSLMVSIFSSLIFNLLFSSVQGKKAFWWGIILMIPWFLIFTIII